MADSIIHIFDLDGTIFDTHDATKFAYEAAGLPLYESSYFGLTAEEWGCPEHIHKKKQEVFPTYKHYIRETWAANMYKAMLPSGSAFILTGASKSTVDVCQSTVPWELRTPFGVGLTSAEKRKIICLFSTLFKYKVFYYDDNYEFGIKLALDNADIKFLTKGDSIP